MQESLQQVDKEGSKVFGLLSSITDPGSMGTKMKIEMEDRGCIAMREGALREGCVCVCVGLRTRDLEWDLLVYRVCECIGCASMF